MTEQLNNNKNTGKTVIGVYVFSVTIRKKHLDVNEILQKERSMNEITTGKELDLWGMDLSWKISRLYKGVFRTHER